jgi:hypothetical protein
MALVICLAESCNEGRPVPGYVSVCLPEAVHGSIGDWQTVSGSVELFSNLQPWALLSGRRYFPGVDPNWRKEPVRSLQSDRSSQRDGINSVCTELNVLKYGHRYIPSESCNESSVMRDPFLAVSLRASSCGSSYKSG